MGLYVRRTEAVGGGVTALFTTTTCRHCGGELETVNEGHTDGVRATWVGACVSCRRQWVVVASMAQVPTRGRP